MYRFYKFFWHHSFSSIVQKMNYYIRDNFGQSWQTTAKYLFTIYYSRKFFSIFFKTIFILWMENNFSKLVSFWHTGHKKHLHLYDGRTHGNNTLIISPCFQSNGPVSLHCTSRHPHYVVQTLRPRVREASRHEPLVFQKVN